MTDAHDFSPDPIAIDRWSGWGRLPMYIAHHDEERELAIWHLQGPMSADEWARHLADMDRVTAWPHRGRRPLVVIHVVDFAPNAKQRADLAAHSAHVHYTPFIAFVTGNAMHRGALRAIAWIQGSQQYETSFFAAPELALAWLEQVAEAPQPRLRALFDACMREAHAR